MTKYAKYISEAQIELAPTNYTLEDGTVIFNFNINPELMLQYGFKPLTEVERPETQRRYKITYIETDTTVDETDTTVDEALTTVDEVLTYLETEEEYEARIAQEERDRLDNLTLTPADVERALYKAKNMDFDDLKALIEEQLTGIDTKALAIEFRAKDFYRGAKYGNNKLFDVVGNLLGYTSDDMDYLFEHKELPEQELNA